MENADFELFDIAMKFFFSLLKTSAFTYFKLIQSVQCEPMQYLIMLYSENLATIKYYCRNKIVIKYYSRK